MMMGRWCEVDGVRVGSSKDEKCLEEAKGDDRVVSGEK